MSTQEEETTDGLTSEQVLAMILPPKLSRGYGGRLVDSDNNHYIDMVSAWGANLLGYGYRRVSKAVAKQAKKYVNLGLACPHYEVLRQMLKKHVPCAENIHLLKNGSDATAAAIRLARYVTGRNKILHRGYHGAQDWCMASVDCHGVPQDQRDQIITLNKLCPKEVHRMFAANQGEIACLIFDPMLWPIPDRETMLEIQEIVKKNDALLIFDEVVSGFRVAVGGMQEVWGMKPDLTCLGKGIANGMPLSVLVGLHKWMKDIQTINYSLTYRLESLSIVAAIETINEVIERDVCAELARKGRKLKRAYWDLCQSYGINSELVGHDSRPQLEFFDERGLQPGTCNFIVTKELAINRISTYGTFSLCYSHKRRDIKKVISVFGEALKKVHAALEKAPGNNSTAKVAVASSPSPEPVPAEPASAEPTPASKLGFDVEKVPYLNPGEVAELIKDKSYEELSSALSEDKWLSNYLLNIWESTHGKSRLTAYPWHLTLSIMSTCNAKCKFCNIPLRKRRHPGLEMDLDSIPHLVELLSYSRIFLMTGGEPTTHPRFAALLSRLKDLLDPRAYASMITHGGNLHKFRNELSEVKLNFSISLNAATAKTHNSLMGLGEQAFDKILDSIRWARSIGRMVEVSMVVVRENLVEIPDFLRLVDKLDVQAVYFRTLIAGDHYAARFPNEKDFETYPAWTHPDVEGWIDRAKETIKEVNVRVHGDPDQWGVPLHTAKLHPGVKRETMMAALKNPLPIVNSKGTPLTVISGEGVALEDAPNPYERTAPFPCGYPWHAVKLLDSSFRMDPCGFLQRVDGFDDIGLHGSENFFSLWNSPAMVHLRESLQEGPLLPKCLTCPYQLNGQWQARATTVKKTKLVTLSGEDRAA